MYFTVTESPAFRSSSFAGLPPTTIFAPASTVSVTSFAWPFTLSLTTSVWPFTETTSATMCEALSCFAGAVAAGFAGAAGFGWSAANAAPARPRPRRDATPNIASLLIGPILHARRDSPPCAED